MGSSHNGFVVEVKQLRPHTNADRLQIATFFTEDVCVGLDTKLGDIGVYFPSDLQLDLEFCLNNNLLRELPDGTKGPGYMELNKRNVKAIRLRGEKSSGVYLPISCLAYTGANLNDFKPGDTITVVNGKEICRKYIPVKRAATAAGGAGARTKRRAQRTIAPTFYEHKDTEQLAYNLSAFKPGDEVEISLKCHGTSARTAYVPVEQPYKWSTANPIKGLILKCAGKGKLFEKLVEKWCEPVLEYDFISGTRRTVMDTFEGGFYGSNAFRQPYHDFFATRLPKNFTVYYEICGYVDNNTPIMGVCDNKKIGKEFVKMYGEKTVFNYGCEPGTSRIFVYRITITNEDGVVVDLPPYLIDYYCELWGVERVPIFWRGTIPEHPGSKEDDTISAGEWILNKAEKYYEGKDLFGNHVREGVVVRIINRPSFTAYKIKNHDFKVLEGIIKETAEAPDIEEADGLDLENA